MNDIELAIEAAIRGAAVVSAAYGAAPTRIGKGGSDFATQADLDAERAMLDVITTSRPHDAVLGEEFGEHAGSSGRKWFIDPLCGTVNFAAQTPLFAVNVALFDGGRPLACVVADPISGEVLWSAGRGVHVRAGDRDMSARSSAATRLVDVNCDDSVDRSNLGARLMNDPAFRIEFAPRVLSTTLAVAWVAIGRRAGYVSDGTFTDNVHFAAGIGLCRAAGCVVTDLAGRPLESGRGLIVAADEATHARLVQLVGPHLDALTGVSDERRNDIVIRVAKEVEIDRLQAIDLASGAQFELVGHPEMNDGDCIPREVAVAAIGHCRLHVATLGAQGAPAGYVLVNRCDGELCIGQITVDPALQQRGIGSALMRHVIDEARRCGESTVVLNTQDDVVWNRPWYESLGFEVVPRERWTAGMRRDVELQTRAGLDWSTRVHMRLGLLGQRCD